MTIVSNLFGDCHAPCTIKTSFVDFEETNAHFSRYKRLHFSSLRNSPYIGSSSQRSLGRYPLDPFLPIFLYSLYIFYWTCSRPQFIWYTAGWTSNNNQSINKLCLPIVLPVLRFMSSGYPFDTFHLNGVARTKLDICKRFTNRWWHV